MKGREAGDTLQSRTLTDRESFVAESESAPRLVIRPTLKRRLSMRFSRIALAAALAAAWGSASAADLLSIYRDSLVSDAA